MFSRISAVVLMHDHIFGVPVICIGVTVLEMTIIFISSQHF
jgi:type IV secretory pathway VirB3-like protein